MNSRVPSEADWRSEPWSLDTPYAYKHFLGKSSEEAVELFKQDAFTYQEDVMFMPKACFVFYARSYMTYLMSADSRDDSDGASCFFDIAEIRADDIREDRDLVSSFLRCLEHLAQHQDFYDAEKSIYGNFHDRAQEAIRKLQS